ncbi:hypothetical protein OEZ85_008030 [Tetradesmus obliquus]|uniref:Chlorophyll a-b binding protein, chloroplastic n=2 Tax=Tetradesmus obliquus TaxID=3088 RepID=A0A383WJC7_TETOB|nr:hypothetical protein OEZ85_008030 [Tetradesmus obliquus]|eukprot:jgi/Sobl393_1/13218/SZX68795.1
MAAALRSSALRAPTRASRPARSAVRVAAAAGRPTWLPNLNPPAHLKGEMAGDFGFDPLGLGADPARLKWFAEAEKTNGRWAMMAVVGILGTELLGVQPSWWEAGAKDYGVPMGPLTAMEFLIMGFLETKRYQGFKETGSSGLINQFPFDPAGMYSKDMAVKEVKNGRLAMVAFVGFAVQALASRTGPIEGLTKHLSNPGYNITYTLTHLQDVNTY